MQDDATDRVHYFHVELDRHDILFAEGLPAESYLDTGNRTMFDNGDGPIALHPDSQRQREANSCAPLLTDPVAVERIWRMLAARGPEPRHLPTTTDPALHLVSNGKIFPPVSAQNGRYTFLLPDRRTADLHLVSRAASPSDTAPWMEDRRRLGVMVKRILIRHAARTSAIPLDDPRLTQGWWLPERDQTCLWRWTNGKAPVPAPASQCSIEITIGATVPYPTAESEPQETRRAA